MQAYPAWEKQAGTALKEYLDFVEQVGMRFTDIELYRRHIPSVSAELREWLGHRDTARVQKGLDVIHLLSDHELRIQTVSYGSLDPSYSLTLLYSQVSNLSQNSHREQIRQQAVQVLSGLEKLKHAY